MKSYTSGVRKSLKLLTAIKLAAHIWAFWSILLQGRIERVNSAYLYWYHLQHVGENLFHSSSSGEIWSSFQANLRPPRCKITRSNDRIVEATLIGPLNCFAKKPPLKQQGYVAYGARVPCKAERLCKVYGATAEHLDFSHVSADPFHRVCCSEISDLFDQLEFRFARRGLREHGQFVHAVQNEIKIPHRMQGWHWLPTDRQTDR